MNPKEAIVKDAMRRSLSRVGPRPSYSDLVGIAIGIIQEEKSLTFSQNADPHSIHNGLRTNDPELGQYFRAAYMRMITDGAIVPNPEPPNYERLTWFDVSEFGKQWSAEAKPSPDSRTLYGEHLKKIVPHIDAIVFQYIDEALITYDRRTFFACAVMVGAACEKLLYMLAEAMIKAATGQICSELKNAIQERSITRILERIQRILDASEKKIPYEIREGSKTHLMSLLEAIRVQRNDAVHPITASVSASGVWISLVSFPAICRKVYDLIEWLSQNKL